MSSKKARKSTTSGDTVARLIAEKARERAEAERDFALLSASRPATTTPPANPPAAPPAVSRREQLAQFPKGSFERAAFVLQHERELCAEADTVRRAGGS